MSREHVVILPFTSMIKEGLPVELSHHKTGTTVHLEAGATSRAVEVLKIKNIASFLGDLA